MAALPVAVDPPRALARTAENVSSVCTNGPRGGGFDVPNRPHVFCTSADVPKNTGVGSVTSTLTVPHDRKIYDLNVIDMSLSLSQADDVNVGLTSPSGTFVILWEGVCGTDVWDPSNTGFDLDDDASSALGSVCPPGSDSYQPSELLSMFNGQSAMGTWTLTINDATPQPTQGTLHGWGLQITFPWMEVTSTGDTPDATTTDGVCDDGTGKCTLRAAIQQANAEPGLPDAIVFSPNPSIFTVGPGSPLPSISDAVTIWGDPQHRVTVDGSLAGAGTDGFIITGTDIFIEFMRVTSFGGDGVEVSGRSNTLFNNVFSGNSGNGVKISGSTATNNRVDGNTIRGNSGSGVNILGSSATNNLVTGNHVYPLVDEDGNVVIPGNGGDGVLIDNAPSNVVTGERIAGNRGNGVHIRGSAATGNRVFDLTASENDLSGVFIDDASENEIGPTMVIGGNIQPGVRISGQSFMNVVKGGKITTHVSGVLIENGASLNTVAGSEITTNRNGVVLEKGAQSNTIGGADPADRNIISANSANGVVISGINAAGNRIEGNYIGTDSVGTSLDGNAANGVLIDGAPSNIVGGGISSRNIISGNKEHGIRITGLNATNNQIAGNYIGIDASGQAPLGNELDGVHIDGAPSNLIGGEQPSYRNVISSNGLSGAGDGIEIEGAGATGNKVQANYIGTDPLGAIPRPNADDGVLIRSSSNVVGGSSVEERNVISGNFEGVRIESEASGNQVIGNYIGTDAAGAYAIPNGYGVRIVGTSNVVGGFDAGEANLISGNRFDGVSIMGSMATSNEIRGNSIVDNGELGIELGGNGVSSNDSGDADTGPNGYQNFPVLSSALSDGSITAIEGTLHTSANTQLTLEFYSTPSCDASGHGEGKDSIGLMAVITDASGNANFLATFNRGTSTTHQITATATDGSGNTSEFSACKAVREAQADLSITKTDPPGRAPTGRNLTYTLTVTNVGPDMASSVTVVDQLPTSVTFVSASWRNGTCVHSSGTVTCALDLVVSNSSETINLVVKPRTPGTITNSASVSSSTKDPSGTNNTDSESTTVCRITSRKSSIPCP
jgi:uncharacterized repeat protein (TIGR01451 family)/CSLREA domain-containing protein